MAPRRAGGGCLKAFALSLVIVLVVLGGGVGGVLWLHHVQLQRTGSGTSSDSSTSPQELFAREVDTALAARTQALQKKNEKAFLAGFDATQPRLVAEERMVFRNLVKFPMTSLRYRTEHGSIQESDRVPGTMQSDVLLLQQVRGVDAAPVGTTRREYWIRRGGTVVVHQVDEDDYRSRSDLSPVDLVPLAVVNGPLVTVAGTSDVKNLGWLSSTAERAARAVRKLWGSRPGPARFIVFVTHSPAGMKSWFGGDGGNGALGVTAPLYPADGSRGHYVGSRVVVDLVRTKTPEVYSTLRHEFTHAVTTQVKAVPTSVGDPYPVWAEEGFAAWSEELDVPLERAHRLQELRYFRKWWTGRLPPDSRDAFYTREPMVFVNYDCAALVFRYIATRWGIDKTIDVYLHIASGKPQGAPEDVLGIDSDTFQRDWATWVTSLLRR